MALHEISAFWELSKEGCLFVVLISMKPGRDCVCHSDKICDQVLLE